MSSDAENDQPAEILANVYKANMKINKQFIADKFPSSQKSSLFEEVENEKSEK